MSEFYEAVKNRFLRYVQVDTTSMANGTETPTTAKQFDLARMLEAELREIGAADVWLDDVNCVVYGTVPSTLPGGGGESVGFVAHMDTSPDVSGTNVKPWICRNYQGGDIVLNETEQIVMSASEYPHLAHYIGQDLVLTDGTTLLGGR